jgi:hypothetical protein
MSAKKTNITNLCLIALKHCGFDNSEISVRYIDQHGRPNWPNMAHGHIPLNKHGCCNDISRDKLLLTRMRAQLFRSEQSPAVCQTTLCFADVVSCNKFFVDYFLTSRYRTWLKHEKRVKLKETSNTFSLLLRCMGKAVQLYQELSQDGVRGCFKTLKARMARCVT